MMRRIITGMLVSLAICPVVQADGKGDTLYAPASTENPGWQQYDNAALSEEEYLRSVDHNREVIQQELQVYANRLVPSDSYYGAAAGVLGAAVAASVSTACLHLNDSRTLGMVFRDAADSDRSVLIRYRKTW
jgi:hypothetical protein